MDYLDIETMKTIISRVSEHPKVVFMGDENKLELERDEKERSVVEEKTYSFTFKIGDVFSNSAKNLVLIGFMGGEYIRLYECNDKGVYKDDIHGQTSIYLTPGALITEWYKIN